MNEIVLVDAIRTLLGASGARLMKITLLNALESTGGRTGLQTMCGGGMVTATRIGGGN